MLTKKIKEISQGNKHIDLLRNEDSVFATLGRLESNKSVNGPVKMINQSFGRNGKFESKDEAGGKRSISAVQLSQMEKNKSIFMVL